MADVIWPIGTDSSDKLRHTLKEYLAAKIAANKSALPRRHYAVVLEGERQKTGVSIVVATQPDEAPAWPYRLNERRVLEERHGIAIIVKADTKSGGSDSALKLFSFVRALFNTDAERAALQALGVQNINETSEGLEGDRDERSESVAFSRQLNLKATTEIYLT